MLFLDLKRANVAISSGRLDDAFQILLTSDQREHRDGQRLTDRLTDAFVDRAHQHLTDGRLRDAEHDSNKALKLSGRTPVIAELKLKISAAETDRRNQRRRQDDIMAMAKQQIGNGAYTVGAKLLENLDDSESKSIAAVTHQLKESIENRRTIVEDVVARIQTAIDAENFMAAIEIVNSLPTEQKSHSRITSLTERAATPLLDLAATAFAGGRLDRAAMISEQLLPLQLTTPEAIELQRCLSLCHEIHELITNHEYADAQSQLAVLSRLADDASWVKPIQNAIDQTIQQLRCITASPLGLLNTELNDSQKKLPSERMAARPLRDVISPEDSTPNRSVLQVDGVGGILLLTNDCIAIGTSGSSTASGLDVSLQTEGPDTSLIIRRDGDDYFATSESPFNVNGQRVTRRLLISGDSIAVGNRGRLKFLNPVAASNSAILQITGSRLARRDIRHIVLMADSLLFGPTSSHFRVHDLQQPIVLYRDREGYALREAASRSSNSRTATRPEPITLPTGGSAEFSNVRFSLMDA